MILRLYRNTYFLPSFFFGIIRYFTHKYAPYHKHNGEKDGFGGVCLKNPLVAEVHTQILDKFIYMCILMYLEIPGILNLVNSQLGGHVFTRVQIPIALIVMKTWIRVGKYVFCTLMSSIKIL